MTGLEHVSYLFPVYWDIYIFLATGKIIVCAENNLFAAYSQFSSMFASMLHWIFQVYDLPHIGGIRVSLWFWQGFNKKSQYHRDFLKLNINLIFILSFFKKFVLVLYSKYNLCLRLMHQYLCYNSRMREGCIGRSSSFFLMINRHESVVVLGIIPNVNVLLSYLQ